MTVTHAQPIVTELILGGQKSGKSRRAEMLAAAWLAQAPEHRAVLVATAQPWDAEMQERIARHQRERAERVPGLRTIEEPWDLASVLRRESTPQTLIVVDCLTLWLTNGMMPPEEQKYEEKKPSPPDHIANEAHFSIALKQAPGPVVLVGNEIGLGVIPMGQQVRAFVDALGQLNQQAAAACTRVTLMVAGLPLTLKDNNQ